ncbi:MAG: GH36-type glycosyl hydrolase domain-containing protein [Deferrisomatales bacterium]
MSFAPLLEKRGGAQTTEEFRRQARALRERIELEGWDGGWYLRGFYDDGAPLGSALSEECRIDGVAQSGAVLSGAGDPSRAAEAMMSPTRGGATGPGIRVPRAGCTAWGWKRSWGCDEGTTGPPGAVHPRPP